MGGQKNWLVQKVEKRQIKLKWLIYYTTKIIQFSAMKKSSPGRIGGWMDGYMDGGWMGVKACLRMAYSN